MQYHYGYIKFKDRIDGILFFWSQGYGIVKM